jgi:S-adenosylmethionine synthetase
MFKGRCAECNTDARSKAFKSRPSGRDIPLFNERALIFAFASDSNNKTCPVCYLKNQRLRKRQREEQKEEQQNFQQQGNRSLTRLQMDENIDTPTIGLVLDADLALK